MLRQAAFGDKLLRNIVNAEVKPGECIVGNLGQVNADALVDALKVRRSVEARAHS